MDAMRSCVGTFLVTSGVQVLHSPKELRIRCEHVLEWTVPVTGFAEKNPASLFQDLSFNDRSFIRESLFGEASMKNPVAGFN
jgi:hypothetical protein